MAGRKKLPRIEHTHLKCGRCSETKPVSDFQKCKGRVSGYQINCRACQNEITRLYRLKTNNAYWKHAEDTPYSIYTITNPQGQVYVGYTGTKPNVRWGKHKAQFKFGGVRIILLHKSFKEFGIENHTFQVVDQAATREKAQLRETELILRYKETNNSLNATLSAFRIGMYNKDTKELIRVWNSIREAAKVLSADKEHKPGTLHYYHTYIRSALFKPNRTGNTLGYLWKILPFENGYYFDPRKKEDIEKSK